MAAARRAKTPSGGLFVTLDRTVYEGELRRAREQLSAAEEQGALSTAHFRDLLAQALHERDAVAAELEATLDTLASVRVSRERAQSDFSTRVRLLEQERDTLRADLATLRADHQSACTAAREHDKHCTDLSGHVRSLCAELEQQAKNLASSEAERDELRQALRKAAQERDDERRENARLAERNAQLSAEAGRLRELQQGAQEALSRAQSRMEKVARFEKVMAKTGQGAGAGEPGAAGGAAPASNGKARAPGGATQPIKVKTAGERLHEEDRKALRKFIAGSKDLRFAHDCGVPSAGGDRCSWASPTLGRDTVLRYHIRSPSR